MNKGFDVITGCQQLLVGPWWASRFVGGLATDGNTFTVIIHFKLVDIISNGMFVTFVFHFITVMRR